MGDFRAKIKIEMHFMGISDHNDMWINYTEGYCEGVDDRVLAFFQSVYERGMQKYRAEQLEFEKKEMKRKAQEEKNIAIEKQAIAEYKAMKTCFK